MKTISTFGKLLTAMLLFSQFAIGQTVYLTQGGGSYPGEMWVTITTGPDGTGTEVWRQGSGAYGNGAGPLTDEPIDVGAYCGGTSLYINAYDEWGDSWNGGTYQLRDAAGGGGILLASNGGSSPNGFGGAGGGGGWDFPPPATGELESSEVFITPACPACPTPGVGAGATAIASTTATIAWAAAVSPPGSGYDWEVRSSGAGGSGATGLDDSGNTTSLTAAVTGLTAASTYTIYVRSNCGGTGTSAWINAGTFTTECDVVNTFPFTETFENTSTTRVCWSSEYSAGSADWTFGIGTGGGAPSFANNGSLNARFVSTGPGGGTPATYLVSPVMDLTSLTTPRVNFYYGQESWYGDQNETELYYRTAPGNPWVLIDSYTGNQPAWTNVIETLPNPSATYQIGFLGINNYGRANVIDNVIVEESPACLAPASVDAVTAIGADVATLNWTASPSVGATYNWEVRTSGAGGSGATGLIDSDNGVAGTSATTTVALTEGTTYQVYVQSDCGGSTSTWVGPISFTTAFAAPYCDGTGISIPDNGCGSDELEVLINVTSTGTALGTDVFLDEVGITIDHTWDSDLTITLESPTGTSLLLSDGNGGTGDDYGDPSGVACPSVTGYTQFGTSGTAITAGSPPYNSEVYTPEGAGGFAAFTGEDPNGVWKLTICDGGGGDTGELLYFNVALVTCSAPTVTAATNVLQTSADINWNESSPAAGSGYQWEVRTSGAGGSGGVGLAASGSVAAGNSSATVATGIAANTTYQVYVRSNCGGDFSDWDGPIEFTTPCNAGTIPFFDGFEANQTDGDPIADCWTQDDLSSTFSPTENWLGNTATSNNRTPRTGSYSATLQWGNSDWIFYPLSVTSGQSYTFDIYARQDGGTGTDALITLSYGTAPADAAMTGNIIVNQQEVVNGSYQLIQGQFVPATTGTIYVGILGETSTNFSINYLTIDDVNIYETPTCTNPTAGVVDAVGASNVEFSWTASPSDPANGYNYEIRSSGTGGAGAVGLDIEGTVGYGITNADSDDGTINTPLAPGTTYDIYIQSFCGTGNTSTWIGPISFTTPYANPFCNGTGVAIPDAGCFGNTYAEVQVAHSGGTAIGTDIFLESIGITIDHTWSGDITAEVVSPNGTTVELTSGNGGGGDDYGDAPINCGAVDPTIFQAGAATAITAGSAPFIGTFAPEGNLSDFDGEDPNGIWTLRVCDGGGGDFGEIEYFSVDFVTCIAPVVNAPSALASTSATIDWDASGGASGYNWEIRNDNSVGGSGATGLVNSNSTTSTDAPSGALTANTTYYVWVQTDCGGGDLSSWAGPVEFTTPCDPGTIPFFDGFEANQSNGTDVADCWTQESVGGAQTWTANSLATSYERTPRTGSFNAYLRYGNEDWIFYPLALTGGTSYTAEAFARQDGGTSTNASLTIKWGSAASAGAMTGNVAGADNIGLVNGAYQLVQGTFTPTVSGTYYIGIKGDINFSPYYISIDDISVYETPSCLPPDITDVTNVTGTSVTLNWDASLSLPADGYEWEIRSSGAGGSGATGLEASGSTAAGVLTANSGAVLTAGSQYTLYVRSVCSTTPSVSSTWNDYLFSTVENDLCANAIELPCGTSNLPGSTDNVVSQSVTVGCFQNPLGVWYKVVGDDTETTIEVTTTAYDIEVGVASGSCGSLTNIDCEDVVANGTESITFTAYTGTDYYIYVSYFATGGTTTGDFTISRTTCDPAPIPPSNDDCANARQLNCLNTWNGSTEAAVVETAPGTCGVSDYGVWYTFTGDGQQTTISCDAATGFDHELAIMSGSCGSFTTIDCLDDAGSGGIEEYTFTTTVGVDYYVYVAYFSTFGDAEDAGAFTISRTCVAPPPVPVNDECAGAISLDCGTLENGTTVGSEDETVPGCGMSEKNVWYTFVGNGFPTTITVTPIAGFDVEVGYATGTCGAPVNFFCDDATSSTPETHTFNTVFGTTYYVYVGHWSSFSTGVTGSFTIERSCSGLAVWNGETSTDWNTATNWTPNAVPASTDNAYIPGNPSGGNFPLINTDVEIDEIVVEAGANIQILGGSSLTVTGDIRNDGTVQVGSEASLVQTTGSTLTTASGTYLVKRDGSSAYDYWSSPITASPVIGGSYQYNPATGTVDPADDEFDPGWIAASGTMTPGRGYAAFGVTTKTFAGEVNNGNVNIAVSSNPAPNVSWNLVGNPYPSGLNVAQFLSTNSGQLSAPAVYLWDDPGTQPYGVGDYAVRNAAGGTAGGGGNVPGPVLATAQGFKVNVNSSGNIQFTNAMRSTGNSAVLFRPAASKRLWLNVTHPEGFFNQTLVGFFEDGTPGLDMYDAPKLNWMSDLSLYSLLNDEPYSIQGYGPFYPEAVFPLGIHLGALNGMDITFEIDHVDGLENNDIYLEDAYLGEFHDLNSGSYTFTGTQGVSNDRFFIHFSPQSVTGIEDANSTSFGAIMSNETLIVSSREELQGGLEVLDMSGRVIFTDGSVILNTEGTRINMSNVSDGIYIVRFVGAEGTLSKKVLK